VKKPKGNIDQPRGWTHFSENQADILDLNRADEGDAVIIEDVDRSTMIARGHRPISAHDRGDDGQSSGIGDGQPAIGGSADVPPIDAIGIGSDVDGAGREETDEGSGISNKCQRM
jgi:hypothetical protein